MRKELLVALLVLVLLPATALATPINFSVIKHDGKVASNSDYKIFYTNGTLAVSGKLDADGKASFNLTANTTYIAQIVTSQDTIITTFTVPATTNTTNVTINATTLYALNVSTALSKAVWGVSAPSVNVKFVPESYPKFSYEFATNWTLYTDLRNNLTFPNTTKSGIYTFKLTKITVDSSEYTNTSTVTVPMSDNTNVVAYYEMQYPILQPMYLLLITAVVITSLVAIIVVSGKKAKGVARERLEDSFRFYRRIK